MCLVLENDSFSGEHTISLRHLYQEGVEGRGSERCVRSEAPQSLLLNDEQVDSE